MADKRPFIFLHAPRTAGTTVNRIFEANFAEGELLSVYTDEQYKTLRSMGPETLQGVRLIQGHVFLDLYSPPMFRGCGVRPVTFLREPVARLVSEYLFLKTWRRNHLYTFLNENRVGFREYLQSENRRLKYRGKNFLTRFLTGAEVPPGGGHGAELSTAKKNLETVFEFVGITERFDESLLLLAPLLGLGNVVYESRNVLRSKNTPDISQEDLELARELNATDVELYAFACELFDQRVQAKGDGFAAAVKQFQQVNLRFQRVCALIDTRVPELEKSDILLSKDF